MDPTLLPAAPGPTDVQVWYLPIGEPLPPSARDRLRRWLSADERARHDRLRVEAARDQFLSAHALARAILAHATATHPARLHFSRTEHGRPELTQTGGGPTLRFNLSHTSGMVALAVTLDRDVGVDVESRGRATNDVDLARRFFSPGEADALEAVPPAERPRAFLDYWTLKEAYVKALGLGLTHSLSTFEMHVDHEIQIAFRGEANEDPAAWHFSLAHPDATHHLALAVRRAPPEALRTRFTSLTLETLTTWFHE
jgi:4'-phosphopantetheinyl transferase